MYIIAGLGNPGTKYEKTRHNAGFDAIDAIAKEYNIKVDSIKWKAIYGQGNIGGEKVILVKPQTFMNLSGDALRAVCDFYKIDVTIELIVLYDDISLDVGRLRIRKKGSAGGHNGIKSIIACLGTEDFVRIKIGVGNKASDEDLANHVLSGFAKKDREVFEETLNKSVDAVRLIITDSVEAAQNAVN